MRYVTTWRAIIALALGAVMAAAPAVQADIFRITGVRTEAEASSAAAAQEPALARGYALALDRLIDRLTGRTDRYLVPPSTPEIASDLVAGHEVEEQANTATKYIATITVTFDPNRVRQYFRGLGVQHVESRTRPMLVAPLWRDEAGVRIWRDNPWFDAWRGRSYADELTPLLAPLGDFDDQSTARAAQVAQLERGALQALARIYSLERVLVAYARPAPGGAGAVVELRELDFAQGGQPVSRGRVSAGSLDLLRDRIFDQLQNEWKQSLTAATGVRSDIMLSARYDTLAEWLALEKGIGGAALLSDVRLEALTGSGAMVRARVRGAVEQLRLELRERGVALTPTEPGSDGTPTWRVETLTRAARAGAGGAGGVRSQTSLTQPRRNTP